MQDIWVRSLLPDCHQPFGVTASPILVQLSEEDLCQSVSVGDVVNVVGHASLHAKLGKQNAKLLGAIQVRFAVHKYICCDKKPV